MEEIKVGDYIRLARNQGINRIEEIDDDGDYILDKFIVDKCGDAACCIFRDNLDDEIIKHSPNIIDLIEVGDIVEIFDVLHNDIIFIWNEEMLKALREDIENGIQIKSIVTKEQFNSIKYVIGE